VSAVLSSVQPSGRHDAALRRKAQRRGRERGCWVYIAADPVSSVDPPPEYRVWGGRRGRYIVTLYPA